MKRYLSCLALILAFFVSYEAQAKDVQAYLDEEFRLYREQTENTAALVDILSKGLVEHPDDIRLLQSRADLYCSRGILPECRADTLRILTLKPNMAEGRMMLCMLDELEGADQQAYEECYRDVAKLFANAPATSADREVANEFNYVFASLMANHPDAEKERTAFLAKIESDPKAWLYQGTLDSFDRKIVLREIFGQK